MVDEVRDQTEPLAVGDSNETTSDSAPGKVPVDPSATWFEQQLANWLADVAENDLT